MRLNQYLAKHTNLSRRSADDAIAGGRVLVNGQAPEVGQLYNEGDVVKLDGAPLNAQATTTIMLNKPIKTICSKTQQGNVQTVYSLLPPELQHLTYVGRLDKDTTGLLIMSNDGDLIQSITHPSHQVTKTYQVQLDEPLSEADASFIVKGVQLEDGPSKFQISGKGRDWEVKLREGRNRQIRRTFEALGYEVVKLHRKSVGKLSLDELRPGQYREINPQDVL